MKLTPIIPNLTWFASDAARARQNKHAYQMVNRPEGMTGVLREDES